jgi:hypothetical protein
LGILALVKALASRVAHASRRWLMPGVGRVAMRLAARRRGDQRTGRAERKLSLVARRPAARGRIV